jgi:hypothetical protein
LKISGVAQIYGLLFQLFQFCISFYKKGWATFWATFPQTHLVTLELGEGRTVHGQEDLVLVAL